MGMSMGALGYVYCGRSQATMDNSIAVVWFLVCKQESGK